MRSLQEYVALVATDNCAAWLRVLREGETSQSEDAFTEFYGGGHFSSFDDHPRKHFPLPNGQNTSAAGAYQETESSWNDFTAHYGQMPFTPENQGACALWLTNRAGALDDVIAGRIDAAVQRCAKVWTSLAAPERREAAAGLFVTFGGILETQPTQETSQAPAAPAVEAPQVTPPVEAKSMGVLLTLLPTLVQMIPQLGQLFGSGSEVSNRNIAAAKVVADTVVQATQSTNVQDAIEKMTTDATVLQAAKDAVSELLPQLLDVGGGVEAARKFGADHENGRYGRILEVVSYSALLFLLLANCMAFAIGWFKEDWGRMEAVIQADIGVALMVFGYFLGSSISSKRKDEMKAAQ